MDLDVPAEVAEPGLEVGWLVGDLHEPVGGSIGDVGADGLNGAFDEFVFGAVGVVGEEHAAVRLEAVSYE